jgi:hypothetical protein
MIDGSFLKGISYYILSPGKSYIIYNIAMVLGFFAIKDFFKRNASYCVFVLLLLLSNLVCYSFVFTRGSLFSWGPRYLFPTLPLLTLFLAEFINNNRGVKARIAVSSLAILGFLIQLPNLFINFSKYLFFVKEKLLLPEYMIDYVPELSPIRGAWALLLSLVNRRISGESAHFLFNPDYQFIPRVNVSLKGYDMVDICWVNMAKVSPCIAPFAIAVVVLLVIILAVSSMKLAGLIWKKGRSLS